MKNNKVSLYKPNPDKKVSSNIYKTSFQGLYYVSPTFFPDFRGFYSELCKLDELEKVIGSPFKVRQMNSSVSKLNVIRGIHAEDWNKLAVVTTGVCFCALVDLRPESKTFSKVEYFKLGFEADGLKGGLYIPSGVGNSFCVLKAPLNYLYLVDKLYQERDSKGDLAISVFDKDLNISWPILQGKMLLSKRDKESISLRRLFPNKF
ncbi:hypothetical protein COT75_04605 [Candidatus Beckwithbacteria bacterium CG10_big_fil_rev_8_21_14_0_10_34_10]|uniref:dTDP-4-dehydrorhamnose 3,5-epimerase n=1 Tax=Candidatus Beckwithbacteria bacterium CG10_big_fil_rev_8_21_14_0_10_34_10 TaxID=1974495 RepID=A0A2H0W8A0_9BACT|nr:MAG: hypothetical protein COT75_04605 [Candidatus Beckwithbacteria bacterium CG10_big_fil_rev_8_21_14_0_10_34_10]